MSEIATPPPQKSPPARAAEPNPFDSIASRIGLDESTQPTPPPAEKPKALPKIEGRKAPKAVLPEPVKPTEPRKGAGVSPEPKPAVDALKEATEEFGEVLETPETEEASADAAETPETPETETEAEPDKRRIEPAWFRKQIEKTASELKAERDAKARLEARLKELEPKEKETTSLAETLAQERKQREELAAELRMLKQEVSPEFKDKYEKPFNEAAEAAAEVIKQFPVTNPDGTTRTAVWEQDFAGIYQLPYIEAKKRAVELFGDEAGTVMGYYNNLHAMERTASKAREAEKAKWKETEAQRAAQQTQQREAWNIATAKALEGLRAKFPDRYAPDPSDPETEKALAKGRGLFEYQPKTFQEAVLKDANIRLAVEAHPRLVHELKKLKTELEGYKAKLAGKKEGEPGGQKRQTATAPASGDDWDSDMAKFKQSR